MVLVEMGSKHILHNRKPRDNVVTEISRYSCMLFEAMKINIERYFPTVGMEIKKQVWEECILRLSVSQTEAQ